MSLKINTREKRQAVLNRFYGGKRTIGMHDFNVDTGICKNCSTFIGDAKMRLCNVITREEVARFRNYEG